MSPRESTARAMPAGTLRDDGAAWALPARRPITAATQASDDSLRALLANDADEAPALPARLAPERLVRGVLLRWRMILLVVLACAIAGLTAAMTIVDRQWQAATTLIISDRKAALSIGGGQPYETRDYGLETLLDTLKLPSSLDTALRRSRVDATARELARAVDVSLAQKSDVLNLQVNWSSPAEAARLANNLAEVFVERTTSIRRQQAAEDHGRYTRQLGEARRRLGAIDAEILSFQQANQVANFDEEIKARLIDLSRLQAEHWSDQGELDALRAARADFERALAAAPETVTATLYRNPLGKRLEEVEWQLKEARTRYTDENPKVVKLSQQADALREIAAGSELSGGETTRSPNDLRRDLKVKLQDLVTSLHVAEGREVGLANSIAQMEAKIRGLAAMEKQFRQLEARQIAARELERSLSSKVEEAGVAMTSGEPSLQIVERAVPPADPEPSGRRLLLAACIVLGALLAFVIALVRELSDPRVICREDITDLTDADGVVAEVAREDVKGAEGPGVASPAFHSFRRLFNDLHAAVPDWQHLAVVSAGAGEGRTMAAASLALCAAVRGERVVLVDADLRCDAGPRAVSHEAGMRGFADLIDGGTDPSECLQRGWHERLATLAAGTTGRSGDAVLMLGQSDAARALELLVARGRRVVLDLPPAGTDEGAFEMACRASAAVVVARHGVSRRSATQALVNRLRSRGTRVLGVVIVDVPSERLHPYAGPAPLDALRLEARRLLQLARRLLQLARRLSRRPARA